MKPEVVILIVVAVISFIGASPFLIDAWHIRPWKKDAAASSKE